MLTKRRLHGVQILGVANTFDGSDGHVLRLHRQQRTGLNCAAIGMHGARATLRRVATHMSTGQPQVLAQYIHQQRMRWHIKFVNAAVHRQSNSHPLSLSAGK